MRISSEEMISCVEPTVRCSYQSLTAPCSIDELLKPELFPSTYPYMCPDGTPIFYSHPSHKEKRITLCSRFWTFRAYKTSYSRRYYFEKIWGWENTWKTQFLLFVDFDNPGNLTHRLLLEGSARIGRADYADTMNAGWAWFREELQRSIGNEGVVISTRGKKARIVHVIEYPEPVKRPHVEDCIRIIKERYPEYLDMLDLRPQALSTAFILDRDKHVLAKYLPFLDVIPARVESLSTEIVPIEPESIFEYHSLDELPKEFRDYEKSHLAGLIKILCLMPELARNGWGISQKGLARKLKISQAMAGRLIKKAIKEGLLAVKDGNYIKNKKAIIYSAQGRLKRYLLGRLKASQGSYKLPKTINDGQWNSSLLTAYVRNFRRSPEKFLEWVSGIPGSNQKDRLFQAKNILRWGRVKCPP